MLIEIWEYLYNTHKQAMTEYTHSIYPPPYSGQLFCKGLFPLEDAKLYDHQALTPTHRSPPPYCEDFNLYKFSIQWRVRQNKTADGSWYDSNNLGRHPHEEEGLCDPGRHRRGYGPAMSVGRRTTGKPRTLSAKRRTVTSLPPLRIPPDNGVSYLTMPTQNPEYDDFIPATTPGYESDEEYDESDRLSSDKRWDREEYEGGIDG